MMLQAIFEIILAIVTFFIARQFWVCFKRDKFLRQVICNESYLESFISRDALDNPSPTIAPFARPNQIGYFINIQAVIEADRGSVRRIKVFFAIVLIAIAVSSYFLGMPYLIINTVVLLLGGLGSISQPAQESVLQHVLALALILRKWHIENPAECEQWIKQALTLRPLYSVVKRIH